MVMTITGFALWFNTQTLRLVPKWALDLATVVHYYEAWLATLAILVWHFYWVIFNPQIYPMSLVWLHGYLSREAMAHEHPRELEEIERRESARPLRLSGLVVRCCRPERREDGGRDDGPPGWRSYSPARCSLHGRERRRSVRRCVTGRCPAGSAPWSGTRVPGPATAGRQRIGAHCTAGGSDDVALRARWYMPPGQSASVEQGASAFEHVPVTAKPDTENDSGPARPIPSTRKTMRVASSLGSKKPSTTEG
jgi:hypothetical protein